MSSKSRRTQWDGVSLTSVCNDTKWEGLRTSIAALDRTPSFRTMDINGYYAQAEHEWQCHFRESYETRRFVDLLCEDEEQSEQVIAILRLNHLSGHAIEGGYRVYGYTQHGDQIAKF